MNDAITVSGPVRGILAPQPWNELIDIARPWASCRKRGFWFAALIGEKKDVAGIGCLDPEWGDNVGWLGPTYVKPEYRGRGIQGMLVDSRLGLAKELKLQSVESAVDLHNYVSLKNLLNAGFKTRYYDSNHHHIALHWSPK